MRLDQYVVEHFHLTRNKAKSLIENGFVQVNREISLKPAREISDERVEISDVPELHWVSRSAGKLDGFLQEIDVFVVGKDCLDIGSSTGGFTQILLTRGAQKVVAIDVGTEQLHNSLRDDDRVVLYENTDIRNFYTVDTFGIITIDVSFISLREIIPILSRFLDIDANILLLFKPQFEVGRENLRKTGVPKSEQIIQKSLEDFLSWIQELGYEVKKVSLSQVVGEAGNQEYMIWIHKIF